MKINSTELYKENTDEAVHRYQALVNGYKEFFGESDKLFFFSAPGRTEIGGNHTDHQHGNVLAASVNLDIIAAVSKTTDGIIDLKSAEYNKIDHIDTADLTVHSSEAERSASLIRGICFRCKDLGYKVGGFKAFTSSKVLKGSGLSSSAAFEILVVTIISHLYNDDSITPVEAAKIAQFAENVYFGKPSGLMDQMACSVGGFISIDFQDPTNPIIKSIDFDLNKNRFALCIVDTGGCHSDLTSEYASIPGDMKKISEYYGKNYLREVDEKQFYKDIGELRKIAGDRPILRAMHFFDDNRLVINEREALESNDFNRFLSLVKQSGDSSAKKLQNIFSTLSPNEQGLTLALSLSERIIGEHGGVSRVHGGGFAGTIQAYVPFDLLDEYKKSMESVFGPNTCYILTVRKWGGTRVNL
jgi:galactokinase